MAAPPERDRHGTPEAERIDAEMMVEAPILDGDESLRRIGRQFRQRHGTPARLAPIGEEGAVGREDRYVGRAFRDRELIDRGSLVK